MNWRCGCAQYILFRSIYFLIFLAQIFLFLVAISPFLTLTLDRLPFYVAFNAEMVCCVRKVNKKNQFSFGRQHLHIDALVLQISKIRTLQMQYYFELGIYLCRNTSVKPLKILQKHHSPRFMRNLFIVNLLALFCFVVVWRNAKHFLYFLCNECQNKSNCNCVDYFVLGLLSVRIPFFFLICYKIQYKNK